MQTSVRVYDGLSTSFLPTIPPLPAPQHWERSHSIVISYLVNNRISVKQWYQKYSLVSRTFSAVSLFSWVVLPFRKMRNTPYFFTLIDLNVFYRSSTCRNKWWKNLTLGFILNMSNSNLCRPNSRRGYNHRTNRTNTYWQSICTISSWFARQSNWSLKKTRLL